MALLEDIAIRRKNVKLNEKKKDIEYAITKRLNRLFKQFIYRFQNEIEIYFEYIKFCKSVGFTSAISGIIGQMLQVLLTPFVTLKLLKCLYESKSYFKISLPMTILISY